MLTPRENLIHYLTGKPCQWTPCTQDMLPFMPQMMPDNVARAFVIQQKPYTGAFGGTDLFGCLWEYEPQVGGSMEKGVLMEDICDWENIVTFPDLDAFDWEGCARENREYLTTDKLIRSTIFTGYFERLIAFVGFENSAMALVDEDQAEAVHALFKKLTQVYKEVIRRHHVHFGVELMEIHDDWGTQRSPMFSLDTLEEMIVPYIRELVDYAHSLGVFVEIHSCGKIEALIPGLISTGADMWRGQAINDKHMLVDKYADRFRFGAEVRPAGPVSDEEALALLDAAYDEWKGKNVWLAIGRPFTRQQLELMAERVREKGVL